MHCQWSGINAANPLHQASDAVTHDLRFGGSMLNFTCRLCSLWFFQAFLGDHKAYKMTHRLGKVSETCRSNSEFHYGKMCFISPFFLAEYMIGTCGLCVTGIGKLSLVTASVKNLLTQTCISSNYGSTSFLSLFLKRLLLLLFDVH